MTFTGAPIVKINGTVVSVASLPPIDDAIGQRSQMSLTVIDTTGVLSISEFQTVSITDGAGVLIFSGFVAEATFSRIANLPPTYGWMVRCFDNVYLADKRIAAATYVNKTGGFIVNDLIAGYLAAEGVYAVKNLLTANQSSWETDTTGATLVGGALHVTLTADSAQAWRGTKSLKTVTDGAFTFQGVQIQCPVANFQPGAKYTFTAMLRASTGTPTVRFYVQSDTGAVGSVPTFVLSSTAWTRCYITVTLPTSFSGLTFFALKWDTGGVTQALTVWMDGCQIEPDYAAAPAYPVTNLLSALQSDFEFDPIPVNQDFHWLVQLGVSGGVSRDTSQQVHGASSLKCIFDGSGGFQDLSLNLPISAYQLGATYTFSLWIRALSGTPTLRIFTEGNDLITGNAAIGTVTSYTLSTTWQRITWSATMPGSWGVFTYVGIRIDQPAAVATTVYIDALQIEAGNAASDWVLGGTTGYQPGSAWELGGTSTVQAGPTLTTWQIPYEPVSTHLDKLSQLAGFYWNIDARRRLIFAAYNTTPAPFTFDGSQADDGSGNDLIALQYVSPLYRNGQYVLGITEITSTQTETRKGDGTATAFTFSYPLHSVPTVTVNAVAKTVGVKGVDTGKDWYWNKGDPTLSQDAGGVKLISTDTLQVVYIGEYQTLTYSQDDGQVLAQQTMEALSTSGKVQAVATDRTLITSAQGFQLAAALLMKYATSGKVLTFKTTTAAGGLASGQLLPVNIPAAPWHITNRQYLIESVEWTFDGFVWWASVKAVDGPANDTWVNFFKRLAATAGLIDTSSSGVSQSVTLLQSVSETWTWTESVTETVFPCPIFPWTWPVTWC